MVFILGFIAFDGKIKAIFSVPLPFTPRLITRDQLMIKIIYARLNFTHEISFKDMFIMPDTFLRRQILFNNESSLLLTQDYARV